MEQQKQNLVVVKGRTHEIEIPVITIDGDPYRLGEKDKIVLTVKHNVNAPECVIKKTILAPGAITDTADNNYKTSEYIKQYAHSASWYYQLESINLDGNNPTDYTWRAYSENITNQNYYTAILPVDTAQLSTEHEYVYDVYLEQEITDSNGVTLSKKRFPIVVASSFRVLPSVG